MGRFFRLATSQFYVVYLFRAIPYDRVQQDVTTFSLRFSLFFRLAGLPPRACPLVSFIPGQSDLVFASLSDGTLFSESPAAGLLATHFFLLTDLESYLPPAFFLRLLPFLRGLSAAAAGFSFLFIGPFPFLHCRLLGLLPLTQPNECDGL